MAKMEAELTIPSDVKFMNKALSGIFLDRTLESIKKACQNYISGCCPFIVH